MLRRKTLIRFVMAAAIFPLFAYTSAKAAECVQLENFQICADDPFYQVDSDNNVSFNYTIQRTSSTRLLSFIDILIPGTTDVGTCRRILGENVNCSNLETKFGNSRVNNVTYDLKEGTPLSKFGSGISDKRALRAIIGENLGTGPVAFSVKFRNQLSASRPKSGLTYVQVTRPINKYDSAKYPGPDEVTVENFGQAIYEEIPIPGYDVKYLVDHLNRKVYDSRNPTEPLVGKLITGMKINFKGQDGQFTGFLDMKNITNQTLFHIGDGSCYPYCYNGRYYNICF